MRSAGRRLSMLGELGHARLAPGTVLQIAVTAPETYGRMVRLVMRRGAAPRVAWFVMDPITRKPITCQVRGRPCRVTIDVRGEV